MSRRFGRNRRRRAREAVAAAEQRAGELRVAVDMANGLTAYMREKNSRLTEQLEEAVNLLGEACSAFDAGKLKAADPDRSLVEVPEWTENIGPREVVEEWHDSSTFRTMLLHSFVPRVVLDQVRRAVHFRLVDVKTGVEVGYAVSEADIAMRPAAELANRIARHTAPDMAMQFALRLKGWAKR